MRIQFTDRFHRSNTNHRFTINQSSNIRTCFVYYLTKRPAPTFRKEIPSILPLSGDIHIRYINKLSIRTFIYGKTFFMFNGKEISKLEAMML